MIRVLLADDQALVRAGFRMLLETAGDIEIVGEAANGGAAVALTRALRPDVVLMDLRMPEVDGVTATQRITADPALRSVHVIALTTFDDEASVFGALRAGASGFLVKDVEPEELLQGVRVVARGDGLLSPGVTRSLIAAFTTGSAAGLSPAQPADPPRGGPAGGDPPRDPPRGDPAGGGPSRGPAGGGPPRGGTGGGGTGGGGTAEGGAPESPGVAALTSREREVVVLVAAGLSNDEIAAKLVVSPLTAKTHVSRAMTKLNARDRAQLVVFAYEHGLARPGRR